MCGQPHGCKIVRVRLVRSLVGCWLVIGPCVSPLARRVRVPCAALDFFGRADMQEDEIDAYDDFDYQAFDILLEQHQAAELNAHLEQEEAAHEHYMAQLREARTPSEVKTDAVISAMKSRDFRQRLPPLLADTDLDIDGESRVTCITPLALACGNLEIEQVRMLLKRGAAVDKAVAARHTPGFMLVGGTKPKTPMRFAVERSHCTAVGPHGTPPDVALAMIDIIELLIDHGAALDPFWDDWREESVRVGSVRFILRAAIPSLEAARARRKVYCRKRWRRITEFLIFRARVNRLFHSLYIPSGVGAKRARAEFEAAASAKA